MADITIPKDTPSKVGDELSLLLSNIKVFAGGAIAIVRGTGYAVKVDATTNPPKRFVGVSLATVDNSGGSAGDKSVLVARKGVFKFASSGLTIADVGKKVYFSDDQTVTTTVQPVYAGKIVQVDAEGTWVEIDDAVISGLRVVTRCVQIPALAAAGTNRIMAYITPTGAQAYLQAASYGYSVKPNFATSAVLIVSKLAAAARTTVLNAANVNVNNTTPAVDTPTALTLTSTAADKKLAAGEAIDVSLTAVGALTAAGDTYVNLEILEVGGSND